MIASTVTSKGQTTLPKEVRDELGLKPGDKIRWVVADGEVLLLRTRTLEEVAGSLAKYYDGPPVPVEEMDLGIADQHRRCRPGGRGTSPAELHHSPRDLGKAPARGAFESLGVG